MIYTLNDYMPHLMNPIARVEAYRDNETAAKLLSAYKECGAHIVSIADLMANQDPLTVPLPPQIGQAMYACLESHGDRITVFCGIDAWLLLLRENMRQDFCYGLRNFADMNFRVRFQLSLSPVLEHTFQNPRYENSTAFVRFRTEAPTPPSPSVCFLPVKWARKDDFRDIPSLLKAIGDTIPDSNITDEYRIAVPENRFPPDGGTSRELSGLIQRAAQIDLFTGLPETYRKAAPVLDDYLSPFFDYGSSLLTDYFYTLRMFRIKNTVTKAFTERAYQAFVPDEIPQRDVILSEWNDGNTGLFVVDGMGAEYYPLLIKLSERSGFTVEARRIASAKLPTSTDFNSIKWNPSCVILNAKKADDISHVGHSAHEICDYAENLSETLRFFQITVMERITKALQKFPRVVVTADHGSSWLAVIAHKGKLSRTISWDNPDDWRYAKVPANMEATDDFESVYRPDLEEHYFVVRGYNRLAKQGGKPYGLHGGASLEERLIPFVVLSRAQNKETEKPEESQMEENDDFLTLL